MPALLIDIGNTNIKFGLAERHGLLSSFALPTDRSATPDSLGLALAAALPFHGCRTTDIEAAIASSVVPPLNPVIERAVSRYLGVRLMRHGSMCTCCMFYLLRYTGMRSSGQVTRTARPPCAASPVK